jgi:hypothetical protein
MPLSDANLKLLSKVSGNNKGLMNHPSIRYLSFKKSRIGDSGIFVLAPAIRTIKTLAVLNLSRCDLTEKGAHIVAAFLKSLAVRRQADRWAASLRQDMPDDPKEIPHDAPKPLKRLIICSNDLGDEGCSPLFDLILEEVGLWAIDLQSNKLSNKSAKRALSIMKNNHDLVILDLRNNQVDAVHLELLHALLSKNLKEQIEKSNIKKNDPDLVWLDAKDPMKSIYYEDFEMARQLRQTESSVKKLHFSRHVPIKITKPRSIIIDKKAKQKQNAAVTKLMTRMNTLYNEGRILEKQSVKARSVTVVPRPVMANSSSKAVSFSPSLQKVPKRSLKLTKGETPPEFAKKSANIERGTTKDSETKGMQTPPKTELNLEVLAQQNTEMNERLKALESLVIAILKNLDTKDESGQEMEKKSRLNGGKEQKDETMKPSFSASLVTGTTIVTAPIQNAPPRKDPPRKDDPVVKQKTASLLDLLSDEELELIRLEVPTMPQLLEKPFEPLFQNLMDEMNALLPNGSSPKPLVPVALPEDIFRSTLDELEDLLLEEVRILEKEVTPKPNPPEETSSSLPMETKAILEQGISANTFVGNSESRWETHKREPPLPPKLAAPQIPIRMDSFIEALDKILS